MAELADAADSKSADLRVLGVRLPLPAPAQSPKNKRVAGASSPHEMPLKQTQRTQIQHIATSVKSISLKKLSLLTKCCGEHGSHICYTFSGSPPLLMIRNEGAGTTRQLLATRFTPTSVQTTACGAQAISQVKNRRPSQGLSREVVDGEGMVQTANRTLRLRTASAAKSARLKRPVRVRLYPRAPCFALALSCRHRHRYVSSLHGVE